jgi:excisionase family DNA binding protein
MLSEYPDILTTDEACEALRIGYNALYDLLQSGKLKAYRNGRLWRIPKKSVIEYILEQAKLK